MREFAILIQPRKDVPFQNKKYSYDIFKNFPGSSRLWKSEEEDVVTDGEFDVVMENKEFRELDVTLRYKRRQTGISRDRPEVTGKFKLWQHKGGLAVAIDSDREISEVTAAFVSVAQHNELRAIRLRRMEKRHFTALISHAFELGGEVNLQHLKDGEDYYGKFRTLDRHGNFYAEKKIKMKCPKCDYEWDLKIDGKKPFKSAKRVKRVGFSIPNLMGESYNFWIADWGIGAVYKPTSLLPHQIAGLLEFFEGALLRGKQNVRHEDSR